MVPVVSNSTSGGGDGDSVEVYQMVTISSKT